MEEYSLAYLAGFIDGEGCIRSYKHGQSGHYFVRVIVTNVDPRPLLLLRDNYDGWLSVRKRPTENPNHQTTYNWVSNGHKATKLLRDCLPYFLTRRVEAVLAIKMMKAEDLSEQEKIHLQLKAVKKYRGKLARQASEQELQALFSPQERRLGMSDGRREEVGRYHGYRGGSRRSRG